MGMCQPPSIPAMVGTTHQTTSTTVGPSSSNQPLPSEQGIEKNLEEAFGDSTLEDLQKNQTEIAVSEPPKEALVPATSPQHSSSIAGGKFTHLIF